MGRLCCDSGEGRPYGFELRRQTNLDTAQLRFHDTGHGIELRIDHQLDRLDFRVSCLPSLEHLARGLFTRATGSDADMAFVANRRHCFRGQRREELTLVKPWCDPGDNRHRQLHDAQLGRRNQVPSLLLRLENMF